MVQESVKVEIDEGSGFCFGVVTAIRKAEAELATGGVLYCLGDIVHNSREVERLEAMGLITIDHETFARLHDAKVLLRAHGEPPETYAIARRNHLEIIDATCPVVLRLQRQIKQRHQQQQSGADRRPSADPARGESAEGQCPPPPCTSSHQIVIYGKAGHAEVLGLVGQTEGQAIVIENLDEARTLDFSRSISLYSQTTKSLDEFRRIVDYIQQHIAPHASFDYHDTICRQVASRIPNIRRFAAAHDRIFFVSGRKSSNGKMLLAECLSVNPHSYLVDNPQDIDPSLLRGATSIGVCGATSTPKWLMEAVSQRIREQLSLIE